MALLSSSPGKCNKYFLDINEPKQTMSCRKTKPITYSSQKVQIFRNKIKIRATHHFRQTKRYAVYACDDNKLEHG